jgi:hypothetical protein
MKEPHAEGLATHGGPESCRRSREAAPKALTGGSAGRLLNRESALDPGAERLAPFSKATPNGPRRRGPGGPGAVYGTRACMDTTHARTGRSRVRPRLTMEDEGRGEKSEDAMRRCTDMGSLTVPWYRRSFRTTERAARRSELWRDLNGHEGGNAGDSQGEA